MKLVITIDLDNAAFRDGGTSELFRVLEQVADSSIDCNPGARGYLQVESLMDSNGNTCGSWEVREYVELTPDEVLSVKDALRRRGYSKAQEIVCGPMDLRGAKHGPKVRVLAEVRE